jgi:uncharacterized protein (DUF1697 family)
MTMLIGLLRAVNLGEHNKLAMRDRLRLDTDVFVRSARAWHAIIAGNPFPDVAEYDPAHLVVHVLKRAPDRASVDGLRASIRGCERISVTGSHAYVAHPDGIARSRLTAPLLERTLGARATGRNWNTVLKLGALASTP